MSKLTEILLNFSTSEMNEMGIQQGAISKNEQRFTLEQAVQAINAYVAEVIGEDETMFMEIGEGDPQEYRNELRAEQRKRAQL